MSAGGRREEEKILIKPLPSGESGLAMSLPTLYPKRSLQ
jgi:hypothetical protein